MRTRFGWNRTRIASSLPSLSLPLWWKYFLPLPITISSSPGIKFGGSWLWLKDIICCCCWWWWWWWWWWCCDDDVFYVFVSWLMKLWEQRAVKIQFGVYYLEISVLCSSGWFLLLRVEKPTDGLGRGTTIVIFSIAKFLFVQAAGFCVDSIPVRDLIKWLRSYKNSPLHDVAIRTSEQSWSSLFGLLRQLTFRPHEHAEKRRRRRKNASVWGIRWPNINSVLQYCSSNQRGKRKEDCNIPQNTQLL